MSQCLRYAEVIASIVEREVGGCDCALLSGGVDTTFTVLVHPRRGDLRVITVDLNGLDAGYAGLVVSRLDVGFHNIIRPSDSMFLEAVDWVVSNIVSIDPIEVSCDAIHYISVMEAFSSRCNCLISGDGGDEVFLGYDFLMRLGLEELVEWRYRMLDEARLPTVYVGSLLGFKVLAPLYSREVRDLARSIPLDCMIRKGFGGKFLLRLYIESRGFPEIAWRPKTPVNIGSGALGKLKDLADQVTLGEDMIYRISEFLGFKPPTRLHLFLAWRLLELNVKPPMRVDNGCPICGRELYRSYCMFCGAYISRREVTMHYNGD